MPADGPDGVRHRGGAILFQALALNCGNLRRRCQAKGPSPKGEADSSEAPPRDGAVRSSVETAVMAEERRDGVIWREWEINRGKPGCKSKPIREPQGSTRRRSSGSRRSSPPTC